MAAPNNEPSVVDAKFDAAALSNTESFCKPQWDLHGELIVDFPDDDGFRTHCDLTS